uniref:Uncharacterized protein n=1 Tax=Romanomermis culicivorax TaxID=13658 RepID=A0A915I2N8_ROMCU
MAGCVICGLAETSILRVQYGMLAFNIPTPWSNGEPLVQSPMLKSFLVGAGAVPPLANVRAGVTIPTRAHKGGRVWNPWIG